MFQGRKRTSGLSVEVDPRSGEHRTKASGALGSSLNPLVVDGLSPSAGNHRMMLASPGAQSTGSVISYVLSGGGTEDIDPSTMNMVSDYIDQLQNQKQNSNANVVLSSPVAQSAASIGDIGVAGIDSMETTELDGDMLANVSRYIDALQTDAAFERDVQACLTNSMSEDAEANPEAERIFNDARELAQQYMDGGSLSPGHGQESDEAAEGDSVYSNEVLEQAHQVAKQYLRADNGEEKKEGDSVAFLDSPDRMYYSSSNASKISPPQEIEGTVASATTSLAVDLETSHENIASKVPKMVRGIVDPEATADTADSILEKYTQKLADVREVETKHSIRELETQHSSEEASNSLFASSTVVLPSLLSVDTSEVEAQGRSLEEESMPVSVPDVNSITTNEQPEAVEESSESAGAKALPAGTGHTSADCTQSTVNPFSSFVVDLTQAAKGINIHRQMEQLGAAILPTPGPVDPPSVADAQRSSEKSDPPLRTLVGLDASPTAEIQMEENPNRVENTLVDCVDLADPPSRSLAEKEVDECTAGSRHSDHGELVNSPPGESMEPMIEEDLSQAVRSKDNLELTDPPLETPMERDAGEDQSKAENLTVDHRELADPPSGQIYFVRSEDDQDQSEHCPSNDVLPDPPLQGFISPVLSGEHEQLVNSQETREVDHSDRLPDSNELAQQGSGCSIQVDRESAHDYSHSVRPSLMASEPTGQTTPLDSSEIDGKDPKLSVDQEAGIELPLAFDAPMDVPSMPEKNTEETTDNARRSCSPLEPTSPVSLKSSEVGSDMGDLSRSSDHVPVWTKSSGPVWMETQGILAGLLPASAASMQGEHVESIPVTQSSAPQDSEVCHPSEPRVETFGEQVLDCEAIGESTECLNRESTMADDNTNVKLAASDSGVDHKHEHYSLVETVGNTFAGLDRLCLAGNTQPTDGETQAIDASESPILAELRSGTSLHRPVPDPDMSEACYYSSQPKKPVSNENGASSDSLNDIAIAGATESKPPATLASEGSQGKVAPNSTETLIPVDSKEEPTNDVSTTQMNESPTENFPRSPQSQIDGKTACDPSNALPVSESMVSSNIGKSIHGVLSSRSHDSASLDPFSPILSEESKASRIDAADVMQPRHTLSDLMNDLAVSELVQTLYHQLQKPDLWNHHESNKFKDLVMVSFKYFDKSEPTDDEIGRVLEKARCLEISQQLADEFVVRAISMHDSAKVGLSQAISEAPSDEISVSPKKKVHSGEEVNSDLKAAEIFLKALVGNEPKVDVAVETHEGNREETESVDSDEDNEVEGFSNDDDGPWWKVSERLDSVDENDDAVETAGGRGMSSSGDKVAKAGPSKKLQAIAESEMEHFWKGQEGVERKPVNADIYPRNRPTALRRQLGELPRTDDDEVPLLPSSDSIQLKWLTKRSMAMWSNKKKPKWQNAKEWISPAEELRTVKVNEPRPIDGTKAASKLYRPAPRGKFRGGLPTTGQWRLPYKHRIRNHPGYYKTDVYSLYHGSVVIAQKHVLDKVPWEHRDVKQKFLYEQSLQYRRNWFGCAEPAVLNDTFLQPIAPVSSMVMPMKADDWATQRFVVQWETPDGPILRRSAGLAIMRANAVRCRVGFNHHVDRDGDDIEWKKPECGTFKQVDLKIGEKLSRVTPDWTSSLRRSRWRKKHFPRGSFPYN